MRKFEDIENQRKDNNVQSISENPVYGKEKKVSYLWKAAENDYTFSFIAIYRLNVIQRFKRFS